MDSLIVQIRPYVEILYFLSTILLASIALYGVKQIRLMKSDMKARSERAAKEKAIEAATEYLTSFIPLDNRHYDECVKRKVPFSYKGPIGDFTPNSLPIDVVGATDKRVNGSEWLAAINKLQSIAAYFTTGVADEEVGFQIIGRTFCATVASSYDLIAWTRGQNSNPYFSNIVELNKIWAPRLTKAELSVARQDLDNRLAKIPEGVIPVLGPDLK